MKKMKFARYIVVCLQFTHTHINFRFTRNYTKENVTNVRMVLMTYSSDQSFMDFSVTGNELQMNNFMAHS